MVIYVVDTGTSMRISVHTYSITCSERISKKLRHFLSIQIAFFFTGFHLGNKFPRIPARLLKRILFLGTPIAVQDLLVGISFLVILAIVNTIGLTESAGIGVAEKVCAFIMLVPASFIQSMSAFVAWHL
jgi:Na+-driven multidrug efflux pump